MKKNTVLLVEDDPDILEAVSDLLREEGYQVLTATDGRKALDQLESPVHQEIALVLLDLMLPTMSGHEFLRELKKDPSRPWARIPIVVTSAAGSEAERTASLVDGYVKKPIDLEMLLRVVSKFAEAKPLTAP